MHARSLMPRSLPRSLLLISILAAPLACGPSPASNDPELRVEHLGTQVRFAVIGDYGLAGPDEAAVARLVESWSPEMIVTLGDNNYDHGGESTLDENVGQYYHAFIAPYTGQYGSGSSENRFFPSLGNHDWRTHNAWPYLEYFTLPGNERYYDFVWGPVHLFALDSDSHEPDGTSADSTQAQWLQGRLAASKSPWQIVYMHHPPYSSGDHGSTSRMQWPFAEWGVDVVLAGHDHDYERIERDGIVYFVNGLGGNPERYAFRTTVPGSEVQHNQEHGAMQVVATAERLELQFVTASGREIDRRVLEAPPAPAASPEAAAAAPSNAAGMAP
jgi:tartrate-resistant acid phosphatase type 5